MLRLPLLKCTAPGIPDIYQGSELWDLHLVDPDNRGPIDYTARRSLLSELEAGMPVEEILKSMDSGMPKLWVLYCALKVRRRRPEFIWSATADFTPLVIEGRKADHCDGLSARQLPPCDSHCSARWNLRLAGNWSNTTVDLPGERWRNLLTDEVLSGGRVPMKSLLRRFPVALLVKEES